MSDYPRLTNFIDNRLPPTVRDLSTLSLEDLIRSRILVCIQLLGFASCVLFGSVFALIHLLSELDFSSAIITAIVCALMSGILYWLFYTTGHLRANAMLFSSTFLLVCVICIGISGGYSSPVMPILICCPMVAFLIGGRQEGIYNGALVLVFGEILLVLESIGFDMLQTLPLSNTAYLSGAVWFITIIIVCTCLSVYDLLLEDKR